MPASPISSRATSKVLRRIKASVLAALSVLVANAVQAQTVKTVGPGAVACRQFNRDHSRDPYQEREYFAWAQGLMSGILLRSPAGVDQGLDLTPTDMKVPEQMAYVRRFCAENPDRDYSDAVLALYKELRKVGKT